MLKVGLTGGIGSGKSIVCQVFKTLGIPIFNADNAAKFLMQHDISLMNEIKKIFGEGIYKNNQLQSTTLANIVFADKQKLQQLNELAHPATIAFANNWINTQNGPYIIKEAALFFESGTDSEMNIMIGIFAPKELRIKRVLERNSLTIHEVEARIAQQMNEDEKMDRCNFIITNNDLMAVIPQVLLIHQKLLSL
jgi:dephospho-CoA kinase